MMSQSVPHLVEREAVVLRLDAGVVHQCARVPNESRHSRTDVIIHLQREEGEEEGEGRRGG
jgi:hypothetical protein